MTEEVKSKLVAWAAEFHNSNFIPADPVQFPHRFEKKQDIEISGLLTALLSFGNRKQILKKAKELHALMGKSPLEYVKSMKWNDDFPADKRVSFYRMVFYSEMNVFFSKLYNAYTSFDSLEDCLNSFAGSPMDKICAFMGVSNKSPQKKLNMFLRWMIRRDSAVDFGIWNSFSPSELIIPLDTHVCRVAFELGLVPTETFSLGNARKITQALNEIFPGDPCYGDFALFGYGVNNPK